VLYGDQLRQVRLDEWIYQGVLDIAHLPVEVDQVARS
jgi:glycerol-3-phosphate dehydrogenase